MGIPWLAIASTGLSAFSSIQSGRVRAGQALQSAELALIDRSLMDTEAKQSAIIRMNEYKNQMSVNENVFANLGRADDPSIKAFFKSQKDIVSKDIRRATNQSLLNVRKAEIEAASQRTRSKNLIRSGTVSMLSSAASFGMNYKKTKGFTYFGKE